MTALAITAAVASLPASLHYVECGQADIPLMMIGGASLFSLLAWMQDGRLESILLAAVLAGGALFVKHEGQILVLANLCVATMAIVLAAPRPGRKRLFGHLGLLLRSRG